MDLEIPTPAWAKPLLAPARYKGAHGGRSGGKSRFFAELMIEEHVRNPHQSSVCLREIQGSLKESVKRTLEQTIIKLGVDAYFDVKDTEIRSRLGTGKIIFSGLQSHTADSIKSLEGYDRAWVEEAQSLSQKSLDMLRPTIRKPGSELWFSWNPDKPTDPIDVLLRGETIPNGAVVVEVNYWDNPWLPAESLAEMEFDRGRDPDKYAHVWCGKYATSSSARVFRNWKVQEFTTPDDAVLRFGADFGFANDPTTLVRCYTIGRKLYVDYEAGQLGCEIVDTPALFMTVPDSERWPMVCDSARPETISHLRKNGFPKAMPAVKGANSIREGVEWLKSHDIIVHPRCTGLIRNLTDYSYKVDRKTDTVLPEFADGNDDYCDALRYALEGVRRVSANKPAPLLPPPTIAHRW